MKNIKNNIMRTTILILLWAFIGSFSGFANNYYDEDKNETVEIIKMDTEMTPTNMLAFLYMFQ